MKTFIFLSGCCFLYLITELNGYKIINVNGGKEPSQHGTTTVETSNATFTWEIKNYRSLSLEFYRQYPNHISSPMLETQDGKKANCSFTTDRFLPGDYTDINIFWNNFVLKLNCDFNPLPTAVSYSYEINGTIKYIFSSEFQFRDVVGNDVKFIIDAFYTDKEWKNIFG